MSDLTFKKVSDISLRRANKWHKEGIEEWSVSDWAVAMAGEAGEVCDAVKKLRRLECKAESTNNPASKEDAIKKIATEIGDTYIYLDLLAQRLGLNIEDCIINTFNRVSIRENMPERLYKYNYDNYSNIPDKAEMHKVAVFDGCEDLTLITPKRIISFISNNGFKEIESSNKGFFLFREITNAPKSETMEIAIPKYPHFKDYYNLISEVIDTLSDYFEKDRKVIINHLSSL